MMAEIIRGKIDGEQKYCRIPIRSKLAETIMDDADTELSAEKILRVLVKRPGLPLRAEVVENTLRSMQELVDGPIECVTVTDDLAIVCNEEGRIRGLSPSASILRMQFVGPVAFVGVRGEDFMSITRKGVRLVRQIVKEAEI